MPRLKICQISGKSQSRHYLHAHKSVGTDFSIVIPDLEITELEPRTDKSSLEGFPLCLGDTLLTSLLEESRSISTSVFAPAVHFTQVWPSSPDVHGADVFSTHHRPHSGHSTVSTVQEESPCHDLCNASSYIGSLPHTSEISKSDFYEDIES